MPVIPTYTNQVGVPMANPVMDRRTNFAPNQGLKTFGDIADAAVGLAKAAVVYDDKRQREAKLEAVNILSQNTFEDQYQQAKQSAAANGDGFQESVLEAHNQYRDSVLGMSDDPYVKKVIEMQLAHEQPRYLHTAAREQAAMKLNYDTQQANTSLSTLQNGVMADPSRYEMNLSLAQGVVDNAPIPDANKGKMKTVLQQQLAATRFDGMLAKAKLPEEIDAISKDFQQKEWQSRLAPNDYERLTKQMEDRKNSLGVKLDADSEAFISAAAKRTNDYVSLDTSSREELSAMVRRAPGTKSAIKAAQVLRNQTQLDALNGASLPELRNKVLALQTMAQQPGNVPGRLANAITAAAQQGNGAVTAGYLMGTAQAEYGANFKGDTTDWGKGSGMGGTSTGAFQFTDQTWLDTVKKYGGRFGVPTEGKTDAQLLSLRSSPETSAQMAMALGEENKAALQRAFGRDVSDTELYMAHFLGAPDAVKFLGAFQTTPYAPASAVVPDAAKANPAIFKEGATLKDVYDNVSHRFGTSNAAISYNDASFAQGLLAKAEKAAREGTLLEYYADRNPGEQVISNLDLTDGTSFAQRGVLAEKLARLQGVPVSRVKPLLPGEADAITQKLEESDVSTQLDILKNFTRMGSVAPKAFEQLGEKAPVIGYAARLFTETNDRQTAKMILSGYNRLQKDKQVRTLLGSESGIETAQGFAKAVGRALDGIAPEEVAAVRASANAYYVEKNRGDAAFSPDKYEEAVKAVLGNSIGDVNGREVILPNGVTHQDAEAFLNKAGVADLAAIASPPQGFSYLTGPVAGDGSPVRPYDIAKEGRLVAMGGNKYAIYLGDDKPIVAAIGADRAGNPVFRPYVVKLDKASVQQVLQRPAPPSASADGLDEVINVP